MSGKHPQAVIDCQKWLIECLRLGWNRAQLKELEDLWWKYHDDEGLIFPLGKVRLQ